MRLGSGLILDDLHLERLVRGLARRGDCTRRRVGAVLEVRGEPLGWGWNGLNSTASLPRSCSAGDCPRGKYTHAEIRAGLGNDGHPVPCYAEHAEARAIHMAAPVVEQGGKGGWGEAVMHVSTAVCVACVEHLYRIGIGGVVEYGSL